MHENAPEDSEPAHVEVTGSSATPNVPVEMVKGATGARIPTGEHRRSGAMPGAASDGPYAHTDSSGNVLKVALLVALVLFVVFVLSLLL